MSRTRSMFSQLVLVIALVLAGAGALAVVLGRELATRPAAEQLARAMLGFASIAEALDRTGSHAQTLRYLHQAGLDVRQTPPIARTPRLAPFLRALRDRAQQLGPQRALLLARDAGGDRLWMQLRTQPQVWVAFAAKPLRGGRRFSVALLLGCVGLTWLGAASLARRLVTPLRTLAHAAPGLVQGDAPPLGDIGGPREVRELAHALEQASAEVRSAADERALMLAGISHDLRTPLTRVQFAAELLPDTDPELRAGISRDIAEIDAILSQFIAYARDGRDEAVEPLDLAEVCRAVLDAAPGHWDVQCPDTAPLRGRPIALRRAVENLVVNAQRHGAAPFSLRLEATGDAWQITVCDQGAGMTEEQAQRALRAFVHDPAAGGSGLGLAIVARVARQHGGALQLLHNTPHGLRAVLRLRGA
ncbi:ATP-binding protein [Pseudoxanthomonas spadix]|jgi:two-component system osmolarity sensor histidine kinase EnvZ|uniref:histidine kinase n=1 Tax=Pseudoxanthomonas spadix (strain BD-a59) TaxID=1045855 RepID=G7USU5_PSEUP|nr:ATP-binding protein [Pseudoxanthomonas spadix]AER54806.1 two-component system sensory histidine kinase [Pseudoxanthomonas spadix BD-a59]MBP3974982.1 HAMP domain-containing protein [Pseudoxanthomonas spadix]RMW92854.1 HAMP domain-containing protein [Pseudoxanthomonas spadix]